MTDTSEKYAKPAADPTCPESRSAPPMASELSVSARRRFLKTVGLLGAASVMPLTVVELRAKTNPAGVTDSKRWGLMIDTSKCASGCDACVRGCHEEHGIDVSADDKGTDAQWIRKIDLKDRLTERESSLPMMCQHCDSAPCIDVCPTGASFKRADGIVLVNKHTCIGCRYCMMACPYKARSFIHEPLTEQKSWAPRGMGTVESCTLCVHRIDEGEDRQTACAEACQAEGHNAIVFGDLNDPDSRLSRQIQQQHATEIRADLRLGTGVRYSGL